MATSLNSLGRYTGPTTLILSSLAEGPKHGYALTKDIEHFAEVHLAPGTLYAALDRLVELGLVEGLAPEGRRRPYRITALGVTALRDHLEAQRRVTKTGLTRLAWCMGHAVTSPERRAQRSLRWYPRSWRATHADEFTALLEDSMSDRPFWPRRAFGIAVQGVRLRSTELRLAFHASRRRALVGSSASLVVLLGAVAAITGGFGLLGASGPTVGKMPYEPGKAVAYNSIPDYISVVIGQNKIGYTPKVFVAEPSGSSDNSLVGRPAPVYASNLTTLLGHEYAGIGFVPLGSSPWNQSCRTETVTEMGPDGPTSNTIPCPSTTLVLPNVVGMVTPTALGQLSGLGVDVVIENVHSRAIAPGHVVAIYPSAGATVHARQPVIVHISVR